MSRFGSIGTQYFDDAGDPLIGGKLYFYDPGTLDDKSTYSDIGQTVANSQPVILSASGRQPNIFFSGSAKSVLTDWDDVQIEVRDPVGGDTTQSAFSDWNTDTVYSVPDIVVGPDGSFYVSITDGNEGNDPTTSPANWTQVQFIRTWNTNETYDIGAIVIGTDNLLYTGRTPSNQGNNPVSDVGNWAPAAEAEVSPVIRAAAKQFAYTNL